MYDEEDDDGPTVAKQAAFSDAHALVRRLIENEELPAFDVGKGIFTAAIVALRKTLSDEEVAAFLYKWADDYATRKLRLPD
jgi:hypothetical protein